MATGIAHVEAALACIERASEKVDREMAARLEATAALLRGTTDRFYLKTRVGVPFARRCEKAAQALEVLLAEQDAGSTPDDGERLQAALATALQALEKAAKTLDERSRMQGMAIT
jgi:hypothetical protein